MGNAGGLGTMHIDGRDYPVSTVLDLLMVQRLSGGKAAWASFDAAPKAVQLRTEHEWAYTPIGKRICGLIKQRPRGRRKGSTQPEEEKRAHYEEQLENLIAAIRSWYAIHTSYPTKREAMRQIRWSGDPKCVWYLLNALKLPKWRTFVRQVVHSELTSQIGK